MSKRKGAIEKKEYNPNGESSSAVAAISYEIEKMKVDGASASAFLDTNLVAERGKGMKSIKILIILVLTSMILGGCKSKMDVQKELGPIIAEYQGRDLHTYFERKYNRNVLISSQTEIRKKDEGLIVKGMYLYYYAEEKIAYGVYYADHFKGGKSLETEETFEIPIKFDQEGYHVKSGFEQDIEKVEEIKAFQFMFETVKLTPDYLNTLKMIDSHYSPELPSYSQEYKLTSNEKNIHNFIKNRTKEKYDQGYSISFSESMGNEMKVSFDEKDNNRLTERFSYSVSPENNDYKGQFTGETSEDE